ncbi:hypothetical protein, partial [Thiolapillus sp.]
SAFDNLFVPQPSWSPSTTQQLRKLVAAPYLAPNDWTPRSEAYFVFPLAQGTPGKQCGLAATGDYQPSLRSPWLAARVWISGSVNGMPSRLTASHTKDATSRCASMIALPLSGSMFQLLSAIILHFLFPTSTPPVAQAVKTPQQAIPVPRRPRTHGQIRPTDC